MFTLEDLGLSARVAQTNLPLLAIEYLPSLLLHTAPIYH